MDRKRILLAMATIIVGMMFASSLWMIMYEPQPEPVEEGFLLAAPLGEADRPYETFGLMLAAVCFTIMVSIAWVGAIHLKVDKLKVLDEQRKKGLISEMEFKQRVEEILSDY